MERRRHLGARRRKIPRKKRFFAEFRDESRPSKRREQRNSKRQKAIGYGSDGFDGLAPRQCLEGRHGGQWLDLLFPTASGRFGFPRGFAKDNSPTNGERSAIGATGTPP